MTDWPDDLQKWIVDHPEHILFKAAQLRRQGSIRLDEVISDIDPWQYAVRVIWSTMMYYRRTHKMEDFDECAEQVFRVFVKRRLDWTP